MAPSGPANAVRSSDRNPSSVSSPTSLSHASAAEVGAEEARRQAVGESEQLQRRTTVVEGEEGGALQQQSVRGRRVAWRRGSGGTQAPTHARPPAAQEEVADAVGDDLKHEGEDHEEGEHLQAAAARCVVRVGAAPRAITQHTSVIGRLRALPACSQSAREQWAGFTP